MFRKRIHQSPRRLSDFPQGIFLKTEKGYFMVINNTKRYRFSSKRVLDSWSPQRIVEASEDEPAVARLRIAAKMKFRNGSLLYCQADGKMYLVSNNEVRHITNPDVLTNLQLSRQEAVWVSEDEINLHKKGELLK